MDQAGWVLLGVLAWYCGRECGCTQRQLASRAYGPGVTVSGRRPQVPGTPETRQVLDFTRLRAWLLNEVPLLLDGLARSRHRVLN